MVAYQRRNFRKAAPIMNKQSAGLLMYRRASDGAIELFLAHPGGPFFKNKDAGAWTIPKGELEPNEEPLDCARREFEEETGMRPDASDYLALGEIKQRGGKRVEAWAFEGDWQERTLRGNQFEIEWPPRSGRRQSFPEIDRAEFFSLEVAREKINPAQIELIDRLVARLKGSRGCP
jgi:predicted NUDIX family NTP pyrophosphohydrolase